MSAAHVTFPSSGPVPLSTARPRRLHERWTDSQARTLVAVVRDLGIDDKTGEEAEAGWAAVSRMFGRSVESCRATVVRGAGLIAAQEDSASPPPMVDKGKQRATDGDAAMQVNPPNQHDNPAALAQPLLHATPHYVARNTEPWNPHDLATLIQAYDRSVRQHGTVHWADVTPLFPARSKEACKAQVKTHKARLRALAQPAVGFAPPLGFAPPPPPAAVLDFDAPAVTRKVLPSPSAQASPAVSSVAWAPRPPLEVVTNRQPVPVQPPSKPKLSAERVALARRTLEKVARMLKEDEEWHAT